VVPRLYTDVRIRDLSLDELTRTFSFGRIQGRLEGRAHGLILEDWSPSAFDAMLRTPEGDRSTHRISQRAVDNLASIGGAGGALDAGKQQRIVRASSSYLSRFNLWEHPCRFDLVTVERAGRLLPWRIRHWPDAFQPNLGRRL
jgi:hypothetical protein